MKRRLTKNSLISMSNSQTKTEKNLNNSDAENSLTSSTESHSKNNMKIKAHSRNIFSSWQFWGVLLAFTFGGVGFTATSVLLRLPSSPNCQKIYLPFVSATHRIYCAQLEADKDSVEGLLKAIALVEEIPQDHPLQHEINNRLNRWGNEILKIAEGKFQAGKLDEAISIANKVPSYLETHEKVESKTEEWRSVWQAGKVIEMNVEKQLRLGNWNQAFLEVTSFLNIPNKYWSETKYRETVNTINSAREESKQLDGAYVALRRKGIDNLLEAIETASKVKPSSYIYEQAKKIIEDAKKDIFEYAENLIENKRWDSLSALADKIPSGFELKKQANDWALLASAGNNADLGTVASLELAISEASNITDKSPVYENTQELIERWKLQKGDLVYLVDARNLAKPGDVNSLSQAISKAKLINYSNPLYGEAQREIKSWQREIEIIEDKPFLDRAKQLARGNNIEAWQQAINQASSISSNRTLYSESQSLIRDWKRQIQKQEDQPLLDRAITLGNNGDYQSAIDTARQIGSGRALSAKAQTKIRAWRREIKAQEDYNRAFRVAQANTPESLSRAINIARGVPSSTALKSESRNAINRWSEQLLAMARNKITYGSSSSINQAIAIARMIPRGSSAYNTARREITSWNRILNPPKPVQPVQPVQPIQPIEITQPFPAEPSLSESPYNSSSF